MFSSKVLGKLFFEHRWTAASLSPIKEAIKVNINIKDLKIKNLVTKRDTVFFYFPFSSFFIFAVSSGLTGSKGLLIIQTHKKSTSTPFLTTPNFIHLPGKSVNKILVNNLQYYFGVTGSNCKCLFFMLI